MRRKYEAEHRDGEAKRGRGRRIYKQQKTSGPEYTTDSQSLYIEVYNYLTLLPGDIINVFLITGMARSRQQPVVYYDYNESFSSYTITRNTFPY